MILGRVPPPVPVMILGFPPPVLVRGRGVDPTSGTGMLVPGWGSLGVGGFPAAVTYRLPLPGVPWREEGQDMRDLRSPGRSPVSTASARSMGRGRCRSVSEKPRWRMRIGVRGWRQRCWGGRRAPGPSRGTGSDSERLFREPGTGSIIRGTGAGA